MSPRDPEGALNNNGRQPEQSWRRAHATRLTPVPSLSNRSMVSRSDSDHAIAVRIPTDEYHNGTMPLNRTLPPPVSRKSGRLEGKQPYYDGVSILRGTHLTATKRT